MGAANSRPKAIENPLTDRPPSEIEASATVVYNDHLKDVVDKDVFLRGARLAQYPEDRVGVPGLTGAERLALDTEKTSNIFHQTNALRVTIMVTACAAITQGWQQSSINASSHRWQEEMRGDKSWRENQIQAGLIDAIPWLSASLLGTWLSDPLQEGKFGRRPALFVSGIFCTAFVLATARCNTFIELLVCRLLLGIGIGAKASVAPVFAAEAAADHLRGRLLMMWQLFDAFGIFAGFACVFIVDMDWRVILGTAAVPSIILLFVVFLCPESPRFSIRKRRYKEAFLSLRRLRGSDILACRDLYYIHIQLQHETKERMRIGGEDSSWLERYIYQDEELPRLNFFRRVWALWSFRRNRRACLAAFIVMASQQLCGVNVLAFYSSMVYRDASDDAENQTTQVAWLNFGFGLANFLFTIPAYWVIDGYYRKGRRLLLLVSLGGMFFTLVAISSFFLLPNDSDARLGLVSSFTIVIYLFFYGIGAGPVPFTFSAEVFPLAFREVGMSFSVMVNFLGLGLLVCFVPAITHAFERNGNAYLLYIFAGLDALAFVLVFLLVPSTGQFALEDVNQIFDKPTLDHIQAHLGALACIRSHQPDTENTENNHEMHTSH